jgi:hypothetical protein
MTKQQGKLSILDPTGHTEMSWDDEDPESVKDAKRMFKDLLKKGYQAFVSLFDGKQKNKGGKITKFDPSLREVIMTPPVSGG